MTLQHRPTDETRELVKTMCAVGIPQESIGLCMPPTGISVKTLKKYYGDELATAADRANTKVLGSLFNNAVTHNNVTAQIFWAKTRCGWKEPAQDINLGGAVTVTSITRTIVDK